MLDTSNYVSKMQALLNNLEHYLTVKLDPTPRVKRKIYNLTKRALDQDMICQNEFDFLNIEHPRMASIYGVPKIDKSSIDPPYRPIVTTIGSVTEPISKYVDLILSPHISKTASLIKDSKAMIQTVGGLPFNAMRETLVRLDIEALYSNIPQGGAFKAVQWSLNNIK